MRERERDSKKERERERERERVEEGSGEVYIGRVVVRRQENGRQRQGKRGVRREHHTMLY